MERDHSALYCYRGECCNKSLALKRMLRIHLVQSLYSLSDMATMMEIIDSRAFSEFCGVDSSKQIPDGDTIGRFRALLVKNGLFAQVIDLLSVQRLILKKDTIEDSTIIAAPSSTKDLGRNATWIRSRRRRATRGTSGIRRILVWAGKP